jgi:hypothetical protein
MNNYLDDYNARESESERTAKLKIDSSMVSVAGYIWQIGVIGVDALTAYLIGAKILAWYYGLAWFLAGALGLIFAENLRSRIGNNDAQDKIGTTGVIVSIVAVIAGAIYAGIINIVGITISAEIVVMAGVIVLVMYHVGAAYLYYNADDENKSRTEEARAIDLHKRRLAELERKNREAELIKQQAERRNELVAQHGDGFLDFIGARPTRATNPNPAPRTREYAADVSGVELDDINPTNGAAAERH